ncbi:uncharacterized protein RHO25_004693 [Cercospora beticola]|uniref:Uncharacterized protein n=1 Tax=Cercospora beticola TaxID=122368 RepID=A0ABZ0NKL1_CERBT|nr:hypothetical protein RHO25_004693 [Cercospora beticola]
MALLKKLLASRNCTSNAAADSETSSLNEKTSLLKTVRITESTLPEREVEAEREKQQKRYDCRISTTVLANHLVMRA